LDYENSKNTFLERKQQIAVWQKYSSIDIKANQTIIDRAFDLNEQGFKKFDSLHIACAIESRAQYFLTTDDGILKKNHFINDIIILDPIAFIKELAL